jgi:hypothetical protein
MSLPNSFVYTSFHPVAYLIKVRRIYSFPLLANPSFSPVGLHRDVARRTHRQDLDCSGEPSFPSLPLPRRQFHLLTLLPPSLNAKLPRKASEASRSPSRPTRKLSRTASRTMKKQQLATRQPVLALQLVPTCRSASSGCGRRGVSGRRRRNVHHCMNGVTATFPCRRKRSRWTAGSRYVPLFFSLPLHPLILYYA